MEALKNLELNAVASGIPLPGKKAKTAPIDPLEALVKSMKVGQCVRLPDRKTMLRAAYLGKKHKYQMVSRAVGDGTFVLWRVRKNART